MPVLELIDSGKTIEKIMLKKGTRGEFEIALRNKLKGRDIPVQHVPENKLDFLVKANHQGVIAMTSLIEYQELEEIIPFVYEQGRVPSILILDGVTDVRNFGAIARSAEIFGVDAVVIPVKGSAQINEDAIKSSAGALLNIAVCRAQSILQAVQYCKEAGLQIIGANMTGDSKVSDCNLKEPFALIIGSEGEGLSSHLMKLIDQTCYIPQKGKTESLNVSVATAIILYESSKQRAE
jgi:23S rRNA (guanosine2251-2'-O)-methyltransferase